MSDGIMDVEVEQEAPQTAPESSQSDAEARLMGWVPEEDFRSHRLRDTQAKARNRVFDPARRTHANAQRVAPPSDRLGTAVAL